ncbi:hypothetical protein ES703_38682 [subsurface metagenome]
MIDLASLVMLCQTTLAGGSKFLEAYKKKRFSVAERELLIAAAKQGLFMLRWVDQIPGTSEIFVSVAILFMRVGIYSC